MNDRQLVNEFLKNRSEKAFGDLYDNKTPRLYQMALRLTAYNQHQAEELIQEMWLIALRKLADFEWKSELKTWLIGILINLSREKRKLHEKEMVIREALRMDSEEITEASIEEVKYTANDLEKAIAQLPAGYRQVIILHEIEGLKHKEIAQLLDISAGTSKSQLYYARKALRLYFKKQNEKK